MITGKGQGGGGKNSLCSLSVDGDTTSESPTSCRYGILTWTGPFGHCLPSVITGLVKHTLLKKSAAFSIQAPEQQAAGHNSVQGRSLRFNFQEGCLYNSSSVRGALPSLHNKISLNCEAVGKDCKSELITSMSWLHRDRNAAAQQRSKKSHPGHLWTFYCGL